MGVVSVMQVRVQLILSLFNLGYCSSAVLVSVHKPNCFVFRHCNLGAFIINCLCILNILYPFGWKDDMIEYILCLCIISDYNTSHSDRSRNIYIMYNWEQ